MYSVVIFNISGNGTIPIHMDLKVFDIHNGKDCNVTCVKGTRSIQTPLLYIIHVHIRSSTLLTKLISLWGEI